ncbi:MAG: hypothetical protein U0T84_05240 [Chitinophagales bacterium]
MKKLTLLLLTAAAVADAFCGAPQAINYQAVATGEGGAPLKNKSINVRLSVLDGPSGPSQYVETFSTTTDNAGLFALGVGTGLPASGSFSGISWSKGTFYLQTEIDTTGSGAYFTMGSLRFLTVPYAFYSERTGRTNYSSPEFPDGLDNSTPMHWDGTFSYVVPTGYNLYLTQIDYNNSGAGCTNYSVNINGLTMNLSSNTNTAAKALGDAPFAIGEGKSISSSSCGASVTGFLVPKVHSWVLYDMSSGSYKVPLGKVLVIKRFIFGNANDWNGYYSVNGTTRKNSTYIQQADQNDLININGLSNPVYMIGYLRDR